jgi:predicted flavoprotein YhiN
MSLEIGSKGGFDEAMATTGGASLRHINPRTMESRLVPGLYIIGETLDIDGTSGGYNLQAAFSTGKTAAGAI